MSRLLLDERPLLVLPALATDLGLNEAIVLQQLHYVLQRDKVREDDGHRWVDESLDFWCRTLPFWSRSTIQRTFEALSTEGLVLKQRRFQGSSYAIDYDALHSRQDDVDGSRQSDTASTSDCVGCSRQDDANLLIGENNEEEEDEERAQERAEAGPSSHSPALPGFEPPESSQVDDLDADVEEVWDHYVTVHQPRKTDLLPQERKLIRDTLRQKIADKDELKFAITGCSCSPHHMGKNDRRKKYNALSQIIKGKQGGKTAREQIDMMIGYAEGAGKTRTTVAGSGDTLTTRQLIDHAPPLLAPKVKQRVQDILTARRHPDRDGAIEWGEKAERMMLEDFKVRPIFDGQGEDTLITGWERA